MKNEVDNVCCETFKSNIHLMGWYKLTLPDDVQYVMPHVLGTNVRIQYCPSCGKSCRDIILSNDFFHEN